MLSADFLHLEESVNLVNQYADIFHLDIMDGIFVPNISFGFPVVEAIASKAQKPMDVHLMIEHPEAYIERFAATGARMISFHLEAAPEAAPILSLAKKCGAKAGLVINPDKPVESLFPYLEQCDFVLLMSVFAGFGGQKFIPQTLSRVRRLREEIFRRGLHCPIEVDGGVGAKNAASLVEAGAEILVAGSSVFKAEDPVGAIAALRCGGSQPA